MVRSMPSPEISAGKRAVPDAATEEKLPKWVFVSLLVHIGLIVCLFLMPFWPSTKREPPPSYVVDLVGGVRIGEKNLGTRLPTETKLKSRPAEPPPQAKPAPPAPPKNVAKAKPVPPAPPPEVLKKKETIAVKPAKPEKAQKAKPKPAEETVLEKKKPEPKRDDEKKESPAKDPVKETRSDTNTVAKPQENVLEKVRERLIASAIERVRSRTTAPDEALSGANKGKSDVMSAGDGAGIGAQSLGKGGVGGDGVLKSVEFIAYQNRLVSTIKANWAWAGRKSDLKVIVQLGIKENGEIVGLKVTQPSGDSTYDESVIRAIKRSNPFNPPPESVRAEFANFNITFRPSDFGA